MSIKLIKVGELSFNLNSFLMEYYSKLNFKLFYPKGNSLTILSFSNISILELTLIIFPCDNNYHQLAMTRQQEGRKELCIIKLQGMFRTFYITLDFIFCKSMISKDFLLSNICLNIALTSCANKPSTSNFMLFNISYMNGVSFVEFATLHCHYLACRCEVCLTNLNHFG